MIIEHKSHDLFGRMTFEKMVIKPPFRNTNLMTNEACFFYVVEGHGITVTETERVYVSASQSLLMKCGNYILNTLPINSDKTFQAIAIHFYPDVLQKIYQNDLPEFLIQHNSTELRQILNINADHLVKRYIESLMLYFENPGLISNELLILKFKELVLLLIRTEQASEIKKMFAHLFSPNERSFKQIMEAHLYNNLNLDDLAVISNLSLSSFKREFKKVFGETPAAYIRTRKLDKAAQMLRLSKERIADVAASCGFNNPENFSKLFTKKYGISPSEFRLNQKDK